MQRTRLPCPRGLNPTSGTCPLSLPLSLSLSLSLPPSLSLSLPPSLYFSLSLNFSLFLLLNLPDASSAPHPRLGYTLQHRRYPSSASYSNGLSCVGGGHVPCVCGVGGGWGVPHVCVWGGGYLMCGWGGWGGWVPHARLAHPPPTASVNNALRPQCTNNRKGRVGRCHHDIDRTAEGWTAYRGCWRHQASQVGRNNCKGSCQGPGWCVSCDYVYTHTHLHTYTPPPTPPAFPPPQHADGALQASTHHCPQCPTICSKARWGPSHRSLGRCTPGHT